MVAESPQLEIFEFPIRPAAVIGDQYDALTFAKVSDKLIDDLSPNSVISRDLKLLSIGVEVARNALFTSGEVTLQDCDVLREVFSERARYQHKITDGLNVNFDTTAKRMLLEIGASLLVGMSNGTTRQQVETQLLLHQRMSMQLRSIETEHNSQQSISKRSAIGELGFLTISTYRNEDEGIGLALTSTVQEDDATVPEWWSNDDQRWESFDIVLFNLDKDGYLLPDLKRLEVKSTDHWPRSVRRSVKEQAGIAGFTRTELVGSPPERIKDRRLFGLAPNSERARAEARARMEARGYKISRVAVK